MVDKRLFSGAILVVTIVVAGASSLPTLLLRQSAPKPMPVPITAPVVVKPVEPIAERIEAKTVVIARVEPKPGAERETPVSVAPAQPVLLDPPPPAASAAEPPPAPTREAAPAAFPPVQPVDVATASGPDPAPVAAAPARPPRAVEKPRQRTARQAAARKRSVRPAIFPLREFLAWRR